MVTPSGSSFRLPEQTGVRKAEPGIRKIKYPFLPLGGNDETTGSSDFFNNLLRLPNGYSMVYRPPCFNTISDRSPTMREAMVLPFTRK